MNRGPGNSPLDVVVIGAAGVDTNIFLSGGDIDFSHQVQYHKLTMPAPISFPPNFVSININERGAVGVEWLKQLPSVIADCERRWDITIGPPFAGLSYNYAAPAVRADGTPLAIKICCPDVEVVREINALRHYGGVGS